MRAGVWCGCWVHLKFLVWSRSRLDTLPHAHEHAITIGALTEIQKSAVRTARHYYHGHIGRDAQCRGRRFHTHSSHEKQHTQTEQA